MSSHYNLVASRVLLLQKVLLYPLLLLYGIALVFETGFLIFALLFQALLALVQLLVSLSHLIQYQSSFHKKHLLYSLLYFVALVSLFGILAAMEVADSMAAGVAIVCFCLLPTVAAYFFIQKSQQLLLDPNFPTPSLLDNQNILDDWPTP